MNGLITLDIGTTSLRATLLGADGQTLHTEPRHNPPEYREGGCVEQDPATWHVHGLSALRGCAEAAGAKSIAVQCVAVTAQRSSVIAVDAAGVPLHPALLWQDTRSAALVQAMAGEHAAVYAKTGLKISPVFSAVKMAWLQRERPAVWARTHKLLGVQDWMLFGLCGRFVTDHSFGSRTNLMDLHTRQWSAELLALFGVPQHLLCELVPPGSVVGGLHAHAAAETGLPGGLSVISAGGDQQCAALGLGLFTAQHAVANTGTGSFVIGHAAAPALDAQMRVSCNVSALPGAYIVEAAMLTTGAVHRWLMSLLAAGSGESLEQAGFDDLAAQAALVPPGSHGLLWLPHFEGAGSPHWDPQARGALINLSLGTTRGELARALLEAIAIEIRQGLQQVEQLCGPVSTVHVSGGMTRSPLFNQIQCDVLERPLLRFAGNEATSEGAWIAGCVASGLAADHAQAFARLAQRDPPQTYVPDPTHFDIYRRQAARAQAVYHALAAPHLRAMVR